MSSRHLLLVAWASTDGKVVTAETEVYEVVGSECGDFEINTEDGTAWARREAHILWPETHVWIRHNCDWPIEQDEEMLGSDLDELLLRAVDLERKRWRSSLLSGASR